MTNCVECGNESDPEMTTEFANQRGQMVTADFCSKRCLSTFFTGGYY